MAYVVGGEAILIRALIRNGTEISTFYGPSFLLHVHKLKAIVLQCQTRTFSSSQIQVRVMMMLIDSDCIASKWDADYRMHLLVERGKECGKQMRKHDFDEKTFSVLLFLE